MKWSVFRLSLASAPVSDLLPSHVDFIQVRVGRPDLDLIAEQPDVVRHPLDDGAVIRGRPLQELPLLSRRIDPGIRHFGAFALIAL